MTSAGEIQVQAIANLAGLGAMEGVAVPYRWTPPSLVPTLIPWLGILGLLLLKTNRCGAAWLIWLPLGGTLTAVALLGTALSFLPSEVVDVFLESTGPLAFGLAGVWLTAEALGRRHGFLTFLAGLAVLLAISVVAFAVRQEWDGEWRTTVPTLVLTGLSALVLAIALSLTAWVSRRRYHPRRLVWWLTVWVVAVWLTITVPFVVILTLATGDSVPVYQFLGVVLLLGAVNVATLLPLLVLSFVSPFYRDRLKVLLHLADAPAPRIAPAPAPTSV